MTGALASDISTEIYTKIISQPYHYHLDLNSSEVITTLNTYINSLDSCLKSIFQLINAIIICIFITGGTLLINWRLTFASSFIYGSIYCLIAIYGKNRLNSNSKSVAKGRVILVKRVQESLGSIRDIIIDDLYNFYIKGHRETEYNVRKLVAENTFLTFFPRYAIESITLILIALIIIFQDNIFANNQMIIPTLGALGVGIQKLLPSLQSIYGSWASINSYKADLYKLEEFINLKNEKSLNDNFQLKANKMIFNEKDFNNLNLKNISFKYSLKENYIFQNLNLQIEKGERLGIIGTTGDGKSTLLDIIMGLIAPESGEVLLNGFDLYKEKSFLKSWTNSVSHVPQNIYLSDKTIAENIALGVHLDDIRSQKLRDSAYQARIIDFIDNSLNKFNTIVGEDGIRLSGGQRQRIGIARALYRSPNILVLDEATSALDEETEKSIMESIINNNKNTTIIIVAHRLKTMKYCNRVIKLKRGRIVFDGDPSKIIDNIN